MIYLKSEPEIKIMCQGGKILAKILATTASKVKPGVTAKELDDLAEKLILQAGGRPAFKHYAGGHDSLFPTTLCVSVNEAIVHGPATKNKVFKAGDVVSLDIGMQYPASGGMFTDMATSVAVGKISPLARKLLKVTKQALTRAIKQVKPGKMISDISQTVQSFVEGQGFNVVRDLVGHGVGREIHEEPSVPNFFHTSQSKIKLVFGMTIAIEPMVVTGKYHTQTLADGWTVVTLDGGLAAHFEHTVLVTKTGCEVLTAL